MGSGHFWWGGMWGFPWIFIIVIVVVALCLIFGCRSFTSKKILKCENMTSNDL